MEFLWWLIIIVMFILSFIGIIAPVIPGAPMIWIGILIYHFAINPLIRWNFWLTMVALTVLVFIVDFLASSTWVRRWGGSSSGAWAAIGGIILGPFLFGPIGVILGPFLFVIATEMLRGMKADRALKIGLASLLGLLGGSLLKALFQFMMIVIFFMKIFF